MATLLLLYFPQGVSVPKYVVEITIHPFTYRKDVEPIVLQLHPVHEDEEGRVYMRGSASLHPVSVVNTADLCLNSENLLRITIWPLIFKELNFCGFC